MGVQVDGKAGALLQSRHQLSRRVGGQQTRHVLDTQGISPHVLDLSGDVLPVVQGVGVAQGVAQRDLRMALLLVGSLHRGPQVADIVQAVENTDDVNAVGDGLLYEVFHHVVGVMVVAQDILAAEQHL